MIFSYRRVESWPPLAWIACCEPDAKTIKVMHGPNVEIMDHWFCEAAWDGDFKEGGFDVTDIVAGSGGKIIEGSILFVSAGNTVDRLVSVKLNDATFVSNSLACLAAMANLDFVNNHNWYAAFHSIVKGIEHYQHEIPSSRGNVFLTYFHNLVWDGKNLDRIAKPIIQRDFSSFERYHDFLTQTLHRIHLNGLSNHRRQPFRLLTTLSTGYDSPTVTALAKKVDPEIEGFTFRNASGTSSDEGNEIARFLNVTLQSISINQWQSAAYPEVPHIAADCFGSEVQYVSAEPILHARILLTGFHGDVMWAKNMEDASDQLVRSDQSGLSLSEYRLWANFLHCPIPFWGARQSADVIRLSNSPNMSEWDVSGDYSRPICRRIVETRGVPRECFGKKKKAASNYLFSYEQFLTSRSMESYLDWLQENRNKLMKKPFSLLITSRACDRFFYKVFKSTQIIAGKIGARGHSIAALNPVRSRLQWFETLDWANNSAPPWVLPLRRHLFPWAIEMAKKKYAISTNTLAFINQAYSIDQNKIN